MKGRSESIRDKLLPTGTFCVIVLIWWGLSRSGVIPGYMLPSPVDVVKAFIRDFPNLMRHMWITLSEAMYGLAIGIALAFGLACAMDRFRWMEKAFMPLLVVTQTIPTIAIAPLLVLWMGFGMAPKITLVVIMTFFPLTVGLLDGYRKMGYAVRFEILDSQHYNTPQRRERLIMVGTLCGMAAIRFPKKSRRVVTAREVLAGFDEPGIGNNQGVCDARITMAKSPVLRTSPYAGMLFNGMGRPIDLSRPCQTLPASMGGNKTPIIDVRLLKDPTATDWLKTLHAKAVKGRNISGVKVPTFMRRITVSEAAALQGFPKDFKFLGSRCDKYRQIGNSVPPPLAEAIAREVVKAMQQV